MWNLINDDTYPLACTDWTDGSHNALNFPKCSLHALSEGHEHLKTNKSRVHLMIFWNCCPAMYGPRPTPGGSELFIIGAQVHFSIRNSRIRVHFNTRFMWGLPRTVSIRAIFSSFIFYFYDFIFLIIVSGAVNGLGFDPDAPPSPRTIFSACSFATCKKFWVIFIALRITNTQSEFVQSREFVICCFFNQVLRNFWILNFEMVMANEVKNLWFHLRDIVWSFSNAWNRNSLNFVKKKKIGP